MTQNPGSDADEVASPLGVLDVSGGPGGPGDPGVVEGPSDAELITDVRGGDLDAYGVLFERHVGAARRLARQLVSAGDVDDLVSEAFSKVLGVLQRGGGPDLAFRAYLLTSLRRIHVDRIRASSRLTTTDDLEPYDAGIPFEDTAVSGFENQAAARAFASLPERWQQVLWHLEVEGQKPADIAPLLGMSANSVSALAYRAREGLRQAFVSMHANDVADETCSWVRANLGAYVRKGCSKRDAAKIDAHLEECRECSGIYLELVEVNSNLGAVLAPALLGTAGAGYLAATHVGLGNAGLLFLLGRVRDWAVANPIGAAAGGVAGAVATAAVATGVTVGVHHQHVHHAHHVVAAAPMPSAAAAPTPQLSSAPASPSPSPSPSRTPTPSVSSQPAPTPSPSAPTPLPLPTPTPLDLAPVISSLLPAIHLALGDDSVVLDLTRGASSPSGYPLSVLRASAAHGTVSLAAHVVYTPDASWSGIDTVRYTLSDGHGGTVDGTVEVITPAALLAGVIDGVLDAGQALTVHLSTGVTNPAHAPLSFQVGDAAHGIVLLLGSIAIYTPDLGFTGHDSFDYTVTDASGHTVTSTVVLQISAGPSLLGDATA